MVKPGAVVIDVGINRLDAPEKGEGKTKLVQDGAVFLKDGTYERMLEQAAAPAPKTPPAPKKEPAKPKAEPPARPAAEDEDPLAD